MKSLKEIVSQRLDQLGVGAVEAATRAGIERTYIRDIVEGRKKSVRADKLAQLADALGLDPVALSQGRSVPIVDGNAEPANAKLAKGADLPKKKRMHVIRGSDVEPPPSNKGDDPATIGSETGVRGIPEDTIPEIDVVSGLGGGGITTTTAVSAANGASFSADVIRDYWRIPVHILGHASAKPQHIAALPVQGDSMSPTIQDGDVVFIDTRHRVPSPPGLYALADEFGGMIVKRLDVVSKPSDEYVEVSIISDNQNHTARTLTLDEIAIVGRVIGRFTTS